jgi:hypothetical protein
MNVQVIEGEEFICQISDCQFSNKSEESVLWISSALANIQRSGVDLKPNRK